MRPSGCSILGMMSKLYAQTHILLYSVAATIAVNFNICVSLAPKERWRQEFTRKQCGDKLSNPYPCTLEGGFGFLNVRWKLWLTGSSFSFPGSTCKHAVAYSWFSFLFALFIFKSMQECEVVSVRVAWCGMYNEHHARYF